SDRLDTELRQSTNYDTGSVIIHRASVRSRKSRSSRLITQRAQVRILPQFHPHPQHRRGVFLPGWAHFMCAVPVATAGIWRIAGKPYHTETCVTGGAGPTSLYEEQSAQQRHERTQGMESLSRTT